MKINRTGILCAVTVALVLFQVLACRQNDKRSTAAKGVSYADSIDHRYERKILVYLSEQDAKGKLIIHKDRNNLLQEDSFRRSPYRWIFLAYEYLLEDKIDSMTTALKNLEGQQLSPNATVLKDYFSIRADFSFHEVTHIDMMKRIIDAKEYALANKSEFVFLFYNLLANADYRRADYQQALKDIDSWYQYHPNKSTPRVKQNYQEIKFMQYMALHEFEKLKGTLDSCKWYAAQTGDSAIIMRMYDLQSQYYHSIDDNKQAVIASKRYFDYLRSSNELKAYAYANLAKNYLNNSQVDSAIYYFEGGLKFMNKNKEKFNKIFFYQNLQVAYALKSDYEKAYFALDSAFQNYKLSTKQIEAEKINEINTRYETEKKDQAIALLKTTNAFNYKIVVQQRWIFLILLALAGSVAFFIYIRNKQKLLKNVNQRIVAENRQLILEQKIRQNQLNPHFIYNAIANLQGLISSEQKIKANQYLILLSRQIRDILELNREEYISLDQEIKSLHNYIHLQQMRYQDVFSFHIETGDLDMEEVMIPPMLIQPFVENAIEHAFKNLAYLGELDIIFCERADFLHIIISDNGRGMVADRENMPNKMSLSQVITRERLDLLFAGAEKQARIEITPNFKDDHSGYKVEIFIPLILSFT